MGLRIASHWVCEETISSRGMFLATFRRSSGCAKIIRSGPIRTMVDQVLKELSPEFNKMYSKVGRPSIPPQQAARNEQFLQSSAAALYLR